MSKKVNDTMKQSLIEQWEKACNGYLCALLNAWQLKAYYGSWIGDEVGGLYDYGDGMFTINMNDIIYCVDNDVTQEQYMDLQEYCHDASEFGFDMPNLRSWMRGCPRISKETFEKFRKMKKELNNAIDEEKERIQK